VLDEADRDGMSAYEVARVMGVSRERIEQVERRALVRLKTKREALIARECVE
jgi:DNA-directed RNA polymerase sigma subunit (sigma70/sigma32)